MDKEILQKMLGKLARWAAVALVTHAVNKGWLAAQDGDPVTAELAQMLLEALLVVCAAMAAGWLAIREKFHFDDRLNAHLKTERARTEIALMLPVGATRQDVEAMRLRNQQIEADKSAQGGA